MKKILIAMAVAVLMTTVTVAAAEQGQNKALMGIQWWTNFDDALKHAKAEGRHPMP
jgi:opacity protein-like surface antigen